MLPRFFVFQLAGIQCINELGMTLVLLLSSEFTLSGRGRRIGELLFVDGAPFPNNTRVLDESLYFVRDFPSTCPEL